VLVSVSGLGFMFEIVDFKS